MISTIVNMLKILKSKFFLFIVVCLFLFIIARYYAPFDGWNFDITLSNRYPSTLIFEIDVPNCNYTILNFNLTNIIVLPFEDFFIPSKYDSCQIDHRSLSMALIVPTKMYTEFRRILSLEGLMDLAIVLRSYDWLNSVSGASIVLNPGESPVCSIVQSNFTLNMNTSYSVFQNGMHNLTVRQDTKGVGGRYSITDRSCYACDLLPDVFLIKLASINTWGLEKMHETARIALFLNMIGRSAYCPHIQISIAKREIDEFKLTCNQLRTIWDGHFLTLPGELGIYRLILRDHRTPDRRWEYWLGCTWSRLAWDAHSPVHCANWIRQYLNDIVDVLEQKMNIDYRIIEGSLLGAVRDGDVIPWSVDADISVENSGTDELAKKIWPQLSKLSEWRYSNLARDGLSHYAPLRAFPNCPIKLTTFKNDTSVDDLNRSNLIDRIINESISTGALFSSDDDWKLSGYVDLYETNKWLNSCTKKYYEKNEWHYVNMGNRRYKTIRQKVEYLKCEYGNDTWSKPPKGFSNWNHFKYAA